MRGRHVTDHYEDTVDQQFVSIGFDCPLSHILLIALSVSGEWIRACNSELSLLRTTPSDRF